MGLRLARDIEGVGEGYYKQLSAHLGVPCTIAHLAALDLAKTTVAIGRVWLWEFKTKAEMVLGLLPAAGRPLWAGSRPA